MSKVKHRKVKTHKEWQEEEKFGPRPLCSPLKHPFKFTKNRLQMLVGSALFTYIGILIVAALYYVVLESNPTTKGWWHELVSNSELRHNIRDIGEGFLGGLLGHMIIWNHYKKSLKKKPNWLDKLEIKLHIPNVKDTREFSPKEVLIAIPVCILYGAPGFFLGELIVHHIHFSEVYTTSSTGFWTALLHNITESAPQKIIGYGMAFFFGRRPAKAVFDDLQLWLAERKCAADKNTRWFHMPTFKARWQEVCGVGSRVAPTKGQTITIRGLMAAAIPLTLFGFYVLNFIARGKYINL